MHHVTLEEPAAAISACLAPASVHDFIGLYHMQSFVRQFKDCELGNVFACPSICLFIRPQLAKQ